MVVFDGLRGRFFWESMGRRRSRIMGHLHEQDQLLMQSNGSYSEELKRQTVQTQNDGKGKADALGTIPQLKYLLSVQWHARLQR